MIPALVYLFPLDDLSTFQPCAERWARTKLKFQPGYEHTQHIVYCNGMVQEGQRSIFKSIPHIEHTFMGQGWDIGTYQHMSKILDDEFIVLMNARVHFNRAGWLARLMEERLKRGDGLYALSTSHEMSYPVSDTIRRCPNPHVRTACFACNPKTLRRYPYVIDSRIKGFYFESGMWNMSTWYEHMGYPIHFVTWDGVYAKPDWRKPANIFRRGDQSNLLVCDRHTEMFQNGDPQLRRNLAKVADEGEL